MRSLNVLSACLALLLVVSIEAGLYLPGVSPTTFIPGDPVLHCNPSLLVYNTDDSLSNQFILQFDLAAVDVNYYPDCILCRYIFFYSTTYTIGHAYDTFYFPLGYIEGE